MFRMNFLPDRPLHAAWVRPARAADFPLSGLLRQCLDRAWRHMMVAIFRDSAARCSRAFPTLFPTCGGQAFQKGSAQ